MTPRAATLLTLLVCGVACTPADRTAPSPQAKNVILFIGDGMGVSTVTATRIFDGQSKGMAGEDNVLSFERFPNLALVKTYNTNQQVPDSAGTATAMLTGIKTRAGVLNVGPQVLRSSCDTALDHALTTIVDLAKRRGLSAGVVTTTRLTHATPAAMYARSPERDWEGNDLMPDAARYQGCTDIAEQLVSYSIGGGLDVMLGGGSKYFRGSSLGGARREPDRDLVQEWVDAAPGRRYVETATELEGVQPGGQVLGIFARSHLAYVADRKATSSQPMLSDMTRLAIELLAADEDGYFLMVESGRIDHGHHDGQAGYALLEAQEFARAVATAMELIDPEETLVMVTADHSHVFTMGGYPTRGNPILGLVRGNDRSGEPNPEPALADDGQPYTTLGYANGPGAVQELPRPAPETGIHAMQQALVPLRWENLDGSFDFSETHAGEDVPLYATGPGSEGVRGVMEQNEDLRCDDQRARLDRSALTIVVAAGCLLFRIAHLDVAVEAGPIHDRNARRDDVAFDDAAVAYRHADGRGQVARDFAFDKNLRGVHVGDKHPLRLHRQAALALIDLALDRAFDDEILAGRQFALEVQRFADYRNRVTGGRLGFRVFAYRPGNITKRDDLRLRERLVVPGALERLHDFRIRHVDFLGSGGVSRLLGGLGGLLPIRLLIRLDLCGLLHAFRRRFGDSLRLLPSFGLVLRLGRGLA